MGVEYPHRYSGVGPVKFSDDDFEVAIQQARDMVRSLRALTDDDVVKMYLAMEIATRALETALSDRYPTSYQAIMSDVCHQMAQYTTPDQRPVATVSHITKCCLCDNVTIGTLCKQCG